MSQTVFALLLAVAFASLAQAADPQPYRVDMASVGDGNIDATVKATSDLLTLRGTAPVSPFGLIARARSDVDRLTTALQSFGYYQCGVGIKINGTLVNNPGLADILTALPKGSDAQVAISFTLGPLYHIGSIDIDGDLPEGVRSTLGLTTGEAAVASEVLAGGARLQTALQERGYAFAKVDPPVAYESATAPVLDLRFHVVVGSKANIGEVRIEGLKRVHESLLRARLLLHTGDPYSPSAIEKARQDLLALGVFSSVRIVPAETLDPAGNLPLAIDLEERKLHAVDVGAGYSTDLGVNLNLAWHHRDLFGGAEQLNLTAAVQLGGDATTKPGGQLGAQFIKPDFMRRDQTLELDLNAVDQSLIAYDQRALIQSASVTRKLSEHWSVTGGILTEEEDITQEGVERAYEFAGVPFSVKYDSTNSLLDPVSGIRASVSLTPAHSFAGGGALYLIAQASGSTYFDLTGNGRSVIAVRGLVAQISGTGVFGLPPDQRLYAGGSGSIRGFRYQSVGPLFADGKPTGGTAMSAGTVEFRQRFLENWGAAAFIDSGQASGDGKPFTSDWRTGVGVGLRYYTSIGPIRVDFAVPVTRVPGGDSFEIYIGIGQAF